MLLLVVGVYPSRSRLLYPGQRSWAAIGSGIQRLVGRAACITLAGAILLEVETGKVHFWFLQQSHFCLQALACQDAGLLSGRAFSAWRAGQPASRWPAPSCLKLRLARYVSSFQHSHFGENLQHVKQLGCYRVGHPAPGRAGSLHEVDPGKVFFRF